MKRTIKDLTGTVSGRLVVDSFDKHIKDSRGKSRNYWICNCSCGNKVSVRSDALSSGKTKSCGCLRDEVATEQAKHRDYSTQKKSKPKDLVGKKYGRIVITSQEDYRETSGGRKLASWKYQCSCGNIGVATGQSIRAGHILTCGKCVSNEYANSQFNTMTEVFISKSIEKHGNVFDYTKTEYIHSTTPLIITCLEHGDFSVSPSNHLFGQGCKYCGRSVSTQEFIERSSSVHNNFYDYSESVISDGVGGLVEIGCPLHGKFSLKATSHMNGVPCPSCSKISQTRDRAKVFEDSANEKFGNRYRYSLGEYVDTWTPLTITCDLHGSFKQKPLIHLASKYGCPKCAGEERARRQHWNYRKRHDLNGNLHNRQAVVYLLRLRKDDEVFLKVGITVEITKRLSRFREEGISHSTIHTISLPIDEAIDCEEKLLKKIRESDWRYVPKVDFKGWTECLSVEHENDVLEFLKTYDK